MSLVLTSTLFQQCAVWNDSALFFSYIFSSNGNGRVCVAKLKCCEKTPCRTFLPDPTPLTVANSPKQRWAFQATAAPNMVTLTRSLPTQEI